MAYVHARPSPWVLAWTVTSGTLQEAVPGKQRYQALSARTGATLEVTFARSD